MIIKPLLAATHLKKKIKIIDHLSGKPLKNAHVLTKTNKTITDKDGVAYVKVSRTDESVTISYMGYDTEVVPYSDLSSYVQLIMANNSLDEVVITSNKKKNIWPYIGVSLIGLWMILGNDKKTMKI